MKRLVFIIVGFLALSVGVVTVYGISQPPLMPEGASIAGIPIGSMTRSEALNILEAWWENSRHQQIEPTSKLLSRQPGKLTLDQAGLRPNWDKTLDEISLDTWLSKLFGKKEKGHAIEIVWETGSGNFKELEEFVVRHSRPSQPAKVYLRNGRIVREYEITPFRLDKEKISTAILDAVQSGQTTFEIPMVESPPKIDRKDLDKITEVISSYTTKFSTAKVNRTSNIRLAASFINGTILMPGEIFSYNSSVGERLASRGFKVAGIYANGRTDEGLGGGICQVSTTLYNAALLANLKIIQRQNHSMPVPYVPLGRDATVDYGNIDLKFQNSIETPIAIVSEVDGGTITFKILGTKENNLSVEIITTGHSSWGNAVKTTFDPNVAPGKTVVVEKGSIGRRCVTWRIVKQNGVEIKREELGTSIYRAWPKIVAKGPDLLTPPSQDQPESPPPSNSSPSSTSSGT
jgi:vancomycin resistance protein YoaR